MPGHTVAACPTVRLGSGKAGSGRRSAMRTTARECRSMAGTCGDGRAILREAGCTTASKPSKLPPCMRGAA